MIYFTDGTQEAFFTAFLLAFRDEEAYFTSTQAQLALGQKSIFVVADANKARAVKARFTSFDRDCLEDLSLLQKSGDPNREQIAFRYFKLLAKEKKPVRESLEEEAVEARECIRKVERETERLSRLLRFLPSESGALYAPLSPEGDVVELLAARFKKKLRDFPFVLHDVSRRKAAVYDGKHVFSAPLERAELILFADGKAWWRLFREFSRNVNIPSRDELARREKLPVRYWKYGTASQT